MSPLKLMRSRTALKVTSISGVSAILVAVAAAGASAAPAAAAGPLDPTPIAMRQLQPQTLGMTGAESGTSDDKLKVTVGKSVVITSTAAGKELLKVLVASTQVSGQGKGKIEVPLGTSKPTNTSSFGKLQTAGDSAVYNVDSTSSEAMTYASSGGSYKGKLPLTFKTRTWVNGKEIDPSDFVNVTGDVKVEYIFTNNTVAPTPVTYQDATGTTRTITKDLPVPFGGSFTAVYPPGWADINAPWANGGMTPSGQQLSGTVVMIPPVGDPSAHLSMTARVQNANLPPITLTAVPINLATELGGLLLSAPVKIEDLAKKVLGIGPWAEAKIVEIQGLLLHVASKVDEINRQTVKPLVDDIDKIDVTQAGLTRTIQTAATGLRTVARVLSADAELGSDLAVTAQKLSTFVSNQGTTVGKVVDLLEGLQTLLVKLPAFIDNVIAKIQTFKSEVEAAGGTTGILESVFTGMAQQCTNVGNSDNAYSVTPIPYVGTTGKAALAAAITNLTTNGDTANAAALTAIQNAMEQQSVLKGSFLSLNPADNPGYSLNVNPLLFGCAELENYSAQLAAYVVGMLPKIPDIVTNLQGIQGKLPKLTTELGEALTATQDIDKAIPVVAKILDNPNCPGLRQIKSLKDLKNCGATQLFNAMANLNTFLSNGVTNDVLPLLAKAQASVPEIVGLVNFAHRAANGIEAAIAAAPGTINGYAQKLGAATGLVTNLEMKGGAAYDELAILGGSLVAMQKRFEAGDGSPYGNATLDGKPAMTLAAWQYSVYGTGDSTKATAINLSIALLLFVIIAAVGTAMWVRRKPSTVYDQHKHKKGH